MERKATVQRRTSETVIQVSIDLDGSGRYENNSGVPFLDHMLDLFAAHGLFDLQVQAQGDIDVDDHHTVEDVGLCLGDAVAQALGDKAGIVRYGFFLLPMDEALAEVVLDLSGRPFVVFDVDWVQEKIKNFDVALVEEFWHAFGTRAQANLHVRSKRGTNAHHVCEAIFKATARALDAAVRVDPRRSGVPSTKGTLTE